MAAITSANWANQRRQPTKPAGNGGANRDTANASYTGLSNLSTLFGIVLAIGIVVDDAIVVVESVSREIEVGLPPRDAAIMRPVSPGSSDAGMNTDISTRVMPTMGPNNSVIALMVKPNAAIAAKAPMMVTGIVVAGTSEARQSCRNSKMTISTSTPASPSVL
ncbi:efflux RND transporter permease subunit [Bradyrhizobium barranii subsp. barranii]|uniref:Efflux RND transporter permease subunit n=1 Tax=Bradyrhizobium barranii subsp. barranii TaxID=2823807 RepID=A0A9X9XX51_9BRAD|nr:efflux RND transporter permease subunit [Bradyrhizobium barranii subsp. barranii]